MTEIKKFKRGHRTYTRMGAYKEVRIEPEPSPKGPEPSQAPLQVDVDPRTEAGVYSNAVLVHRSSDEIILDFTFKQPHMARARILSRVILSPKQALQISRLLKEACHDKN
jgi:hypothetical protein